MHPARRLTFSCLALVLLAALSGQAFSSTVIVGTCMAGTQYATIQSAVSNVLAGSTIEVCPGNYPEQVTINKKLTLAGVPSGIQNAAVIMSPAGGMVANATDLDAGNPIAAQILVQNAKSVVIQNLTVDALGNGMSCSGTDLMGILFQNASGTVNHVAVRNQIPGDVLSPCQAGESVYVQTAPGRTSKVTFENSSVHNYNKNGVTGNDFGTNLLFVNNNVQGSGLAAGAAQNGVQICCGAQGKVGSSMVFDNVYFDPTSYVGADVLLYDTAENSGIKVYSNTLGNSQLPIGLETDFAYGPSAYGDGISVTTNHIVGVSVYDAIDVCTNGNTVTGNSITNAAESGVHLDAACGAYFGGPATGNNTNASGNTVLESACAGILADPGTTGDNTSSETFFTVPFTITSSTGSCTIPLVAQARAQSPRKVSPKR